MPGTVSTQIRVAPCASATLLVGCGSSTIESALKPARFISFGDGFSDVGSLGVNKKYTVNDASLNNWTQQVAASYGLSIAPSTGGGLGYAQGNARVTVKPDAAGSSTTLTVTQQVDAFLAANALAANDVVLMNGGISDIVAEMAAVTAGTETTAQMSVNVQQAGKDLAAQVHRLVKAGAQHLVVVGTYDLSTSPWAAAIGQIRNNSLLSTTSNQFNDALLLNIVDLGANVLYVDAAFYFNLVTSMPTAYAPLANATTVICTSTDPGPGIGTGAGQGNSALCTPTTIPAGVDYNTFLFADRLYFTPTAHRLFGTNAFTKLIQRW